MQLVINLSLQDHVAIVTGASGGLGSAIARTLAAAGASVIVNYATNADGASAVVSAIIGAGGRALAIQTDVTDERGVAAMFAKAGETLGAIDIVVNNVGREEAMASPFALSRDDYQRMVDLNLHAVVNTCRAGFPYMEARHWGRIINIASIAAHRPVHGFAAYSAGKNAMLGLSRNLAFELGPSGITVNVVSPGWVVTDRHAGVPAEVIAQLVKETPLGYKGRPEHIANAVLFFASPLADFVTGTDLPVTGGREM
jgi:3-oxoacyl-[acyl-carrier protein] reductase